VKTQAN
jgi:hypothetical protein